MSFDQRELATIGHWPIASRMPERYGRGVCANELLLRNTIVQKFASGRGPSPEYHIPWTVDGHIRVGKQPGEETIIEKTDTVQLGAVDLTNNVTAHDEGNPSQVEASAAPSVEDCTQNTQLATVEDITDIEP